MHQRRLCIPRRVGQEPQALFVRLQCHECPWIEPDRKLAAADLQSSRHDRLHCGHIGQPECVVILRRDVQLTHTVRDLIHGQRFAECAHQDGILFCNPQPRLDLVHILAADRPAERRCFLLDLGKIEQIDHFSSFDEIAHRFCALRDRVVQALPLFTGRNEVCIRILTEKSQRDVRIMLEDPSLKPQEFRIFLRILPDLLECLRTCTAEIDCCCIVLHQNYLLYNILPL